ncbi:hypothetical protein GmarT_57850 [Gimesia maris]|uniref:Uncharacterized protein n=1 Tax=Gimesia maris TaxID=122 RepID=A0ABX5YW91_9PLAN|nr:hypothetical protein GmarT_57850 [Gimesia maris]
MRKRSATWRAYRTKIRNRAERSEQEVAATRFVPEADVLYFPGTAGRAGPWHTGNLCHVVVIPSISDVRVPPLGLTDGTDATSKKLTRGGRLIYGHGIRDFRSRTDVDVAGNQVVGDLNLLATSDADCEVFLAFGDQAVGDAGLLDV